MNDASKLLVQAGASLHVLDDKGKTPLDYADSEQKALLLNVSPKPGLKVSAQTPTKQSIPHRASPQAINRYREKKIGALKDLDSDAVRRPFFGTSVPVKKVPASSSQGNVISSKPQQTSHSAKIHQMQSQEELENMRQRLERLEQEREKEKEELTRLTAVAEGRLDPQNNSILPQKGSSVIESVSHKPSKTEEEAVQELDAAAAAAGSPEVEQHSVKSSDEDSSSSSDSEEWNAESPYGSRSKMLQGIEALKPGCHFADDYVIEAGNIAGKPHLRFAQRRYGKRERVILKFYWEEDRFENTSTVHSELSPSEHVSRIIQTLKTPKSGFPPCIVYECGTLTLSDWMKKERSQVDKKWCLHQILTGVKDVHGKGVVHCDVKPSNVMFFGESTSWKLIDLDAACKAGESRATSFTALYAAPEVLQELQDSEQLPIAQPSSDIWSLGIVAYEVLAGERFFGGDITLDEILRLVLSGKVVEEKLALMPNTEHREIVSKFLKINPLERWSAVEALQHAAFHADASTTNPSHL